ncbi:MAG: 50S ribosomal protein L20 [Candidatus Saccharimonadales bacterium]|nr:50S ribosomal protein L20 [Candidatus Saccharimonadales bacterium]
MSRVTGGTTAHRRHKKVRKATKGMQHGARRSYRLGKQAVTRSLSNAYRDRRRRKRDFRQLWITRINAGARENGTTYSELMAGLKKAGIELDRKTLADLAMNEPAAFAEVVKTAKK